MMVQNEELGLQGRIVAVLVRSYGKFLWTLVFGEW